MFKKIKAYLERKRKLKKQKEYYSLIARGGLFLKFIYNDLKNMERQQTNRDVRRRFSKELKKEGKFSEEMITYYANKIDSILFYIESQEMKKKIIKEKKNG